MPTPSRDMFSSAFLAGYAAGKRKSKQKCPYPENTQEHREWIKGYDESSFVLSLRKENNTTTTTKNK